MLISYTWLQKEYFDNALPEIEKISDALLFHAFEIEGVTQVGDDFVIDVDVLPNRAHDCLSHRGIAKEISVILDIPLKEKKYNYVGEEKDTSLSVDVKDSNVCDRYMGRVIRNISVQESPEWLKQRLESIGQRSINALVDATNFVMFSLGQPTHVFDLDKVTNQKIVVRTAQEGEGMTTLDGKTVELQEGDYVIASEEGPLAIAGVKGGTLAEVTAETRDIVLEAAHFDPVTVRKTARKLAILTDSSKRFENDPAPEIVGEAMDMLTALIIELCGTDTTTIEKKIDVYNRKDSEVVINVSRDYINDLLGTDIDAGEIERILTSLGWSYVVADGVYSVTIPPERRDMEVPADIVEEIGRLHGYHHIESKTLSPKIDSTNNSAFFFYLTKIRHILVKHGFSEVYTPTFVKKGDLEVKNPVAKDRPFMRKKIDLSEVFDMNVRNKELLGVDEVRIFEIGKIFKKDASECTSLVLYTEKGVSGDLINDLADLGITIEKGTEVRIDDIEEQIARLPQEVTYENLFGEQIDTLIYKPFSVYPFVSRDIAVWIPKETPKEELTTVIRKNAGDLLVREPKLVDEYPKEERVSYAYRLVFQSYTKTLTDSEVNEVMNRISKEVNEKGWEVR